MSYDAFRALSGTDSVGCYEVVLPETVRGFAAQLVADRFPNKEGESIVNTGRFSWIWIVLVALAIISLVFIIMF